MSIRNSAISPNDFPDCKYTQVLLVVAEESAEYQLDEPATELVKPTFVVDTHLPSQAEVDQHQKHMILFVAGVRRV